MGNGVGFTPISSTLGQFVVSNTLRFYWIVIGSFGPGTTNGVLDHVEMANNANSGLVVQTSTQTINIVLGDSVSIDNVSSGIVAISKSGTPVNIMVRNSTITNSRSFGLLAENNGATIRVTRSTITGNATGWFALNSGLVLSYVDNNIDGNASANTEPPNPLPVAKAAM